MKKVSPFIKCVDYWPIQIPSECLDAYAEMIREGQISDQKVVYSHSTGAVVVEYKSNQPHEWVKEELRNRMKGIQQ